MTLATWMSSNQLGVAKLQTRRLVNLGQSSAMNFINTRVLEGQFSENKRSQKYCPTLVGHFENVPFSILIDVVTFLALIEKTVIRRESFDATDDDMALYSKVQHC